MVSRNNIFVLFAIAGFWCLPGNLMAQEHQTKDSITIAISPVYDDVSKTHRFLFGESYRKLWAVPVKLRIVDLKKERGGMKILKLGGGMQTRSLRLQDASGNEWALRTVQKYPERGLPENLRATIAKDIVQDQIATNHPFSSLVVPPLATLLAIPHANPEIIYIGDDPALEEYRKDFSNAVYLLEERSPIGFEESDNTQKIKRKLEEDNDHQVNQKLLLRARLLDFIIGDWDRHEDNWRWLKEKDKKGDVTYIPVPKDRDKVFYSTSGVLPWVLSHQWLKANLQPYEENIRAVDQYNYNQQNFDRYFLNSLSEQDWIDELNYVQEKITPVVLRQAMLKIPANIFAVGGERTLNIMIARRNNLKKSALDYYRFLAKVVEIPSSDKGEYFELKNQEDGGIELNIFNIKKDGERGRRFYSRRFDQTVTEEIRLYGMAGQDVFEQTGATKSPIKLRLVGGDDKDTFKIGNDLKRSTNTYIYDRIDQDNDFSAASGAKIRLSADTAVNQYKFNYIYDQLGPLFHLNYSVDRGVQPGVGFIIQKQGFRKYPYAMKQEFWVDYSMGRQAFALSYAGDFKQLLGSYDFRVNAHFLGPKNLSNFFGFGNETAFIRDNDDDNDDDLLGDTEKGISYYRNRYDYLTADFQLYKTVKRWTIGAGLTTEYYTSRGSANTNRFLGDFNLSNPEEQVFTNRSYAGLIAELSYDSRDNIAIPKKGVYWNTRITGNQQLNAEHERYGKVLTEFRSYLNPGNSGLVLASRLGGGATFGNPAFFQLMQLGGVHSLRGYHSNRFTGDKMAYGSIDMRLKLFDFNSYIFPGAIGLLAFNDLGRVWYPGQSSNKWHYAYGGGIYIIPADLILIQAAVGASKESVMPYISIGFNF